MKNKLIIIGAGGHGKVVADIALKMNKWEELYFLDDNISLDSVLGIEILGSSSQWNGYLHDHDIFVAVGSNEIREKIIEQLERENASIPVLIHPSAVIGSMVEIEPGTAVMAGVVINCSTTIGKGCIINTSSSIDHDCNIGNYVHVSPGVHIAGTVKIGEMSWLGIGSTVINNITIKNNCILGAGSVVINSLTESGTYVGVPIRKIKF